MQNNLFFSGSDKYEPVATLGTGSFCTVYLVRHRILECLRAIKVIPKNRTLTDSVLSEAILLKTLHHPGIPTIYEIEEDSWNYYLIEEYMEGETLEEFLSNQSHISHNTFYDLSTQICEIFYYLHNLRPDPILYMDLKPEHIIICQGKLKLIDFNVSVSLSKVGKLCHLYGNEAYSAPEIATGASPSPKWDIYAIGRILLYMESFLLSPLSLKTQKILQKAAAQDPAYRYETVDELLRALAKEQHNHHQELSCNTIAVVGSNCGCGTTHIAISLVSALNYSGYPCCYYETDQKNHLQPLTEHLTNMKETNGCLYYKHFRGYPGYGPGITLSDDTSIIRVTDYGCYDKDIHKEIYEADLVLFICSNGVLKRQNAFDQGHLLFSSCNNFKIICNLGQEPDLRIYAQKFKRPILAFPFDSDPFRITKEKNRLFFQLLQYKRRNPLFYHLGKLLSRKKS